MAVVMSHFIRDSVKKLMSHGSLKIYSTFYYLILKDNVLKLRNGNSFKYQT